MDLKQLFEDDDAVSPVIGVILMVAITVILAAVIASFVLNLGNEPSTTPQASFEFDYSPLGSSSSSNLAGESDVSEDGELTVTHSSGDSIQASRITLQDDANNELTGPSWPDDQISSGDSITFDIDADDTIRMVYTDDSGEDSTTLATWEGPDA